MNRWPLVIRHPTTERYTLFYASQDGFLHEGSPTGPRLPPFSSRGPVERSVPLNPILVNFSADIRLRRLDRVIPEWRNGLDPEANLILHGVSDLYNAVNWEPGRPVVRKPTLRSRSPVMTMKHFMDLLEEGNFPSCLLVLLLSNHFFIRQAQNFQEIPDSIPH